VQQSQSFPSTRARRAAGPIGALAAVGAGGIALCLVLVMLFIIRNVFPPGLMMLVFGLVASGLVAAGYRWAPALAALHSAAILLLFNRPLLGGVQTPQTPFFPIAVAILIFCLLGLAAGIAAAVQNYRGGQSMPHWLPRLLLIVVGLYAGAVIVARIPVQAAGAGISPDVTADLPLVTMREFKFEQQELRVRAGELVVLRLENHDSELHIFDVDEFNIHVPVLPGKSGVAVFRPTKPGRYTIYCDPHYSKQGGTGMKATLIVE
jgi:cytochrome c oxidase subunit II